MTTVACRCLSLVICLTAVACGSTELNTGSDARVAPDAASDARTDAANADAARDGTADAQSDAAVDAGDAGDAS